jgi:diguanylate cyclase (GGDEF)-like protein/PAS domain S-box-containing protein
MSIAERSAAEDLKKHAPTANWASHLGLNSFRGRFRYVAAFSICFMIVTTWLAETHVRNATRQAISNYADQEEVNRILRAVTVDVGVLQSILNRPSISNISRNADILDRLQTAISNSMGLFEIHCVTHSPAIRLEANQLLADLKQLQAETNKSANAEIPLSNRHGVSQSDLAHIQMSLGTLEYTVDARAIEDMRLLAQSADQQLRLLWLITLTAIVFITTSFFLFEYSIRKHIGWISRAIKAEAAGEKEIMIPRMHSLETAKLVSAFNQMRRKIRARQERLETILDNAAEGIITFDTEGRIESVNQAAERLFGYSAREVVGKDLKLIIPPQTRECREDYLKHFIRNEIQRLIGHEGEVLGRHKDGATFPMALKVSAMTLEGKQLYTGLVADISERSAMLENLKNMAEHDGLTGLYNRSYFQQELERVVERVRRAGETSCALLYIDLDNFKYVNDTLGHTAGDRLIIEVAGILNKRARKSDLIARIGGDEFSVLLFNTTPTLSVQVAESFRVKLADYTFKHSGDKLSIGCSIGITAISPNTISATAVLSQADLACHLAKRGGRNRVHLYNPADAENVTAMSHDMGWSRRIKKAIEKDLLVLAYQPIVNTATREVESYEVLIRMVDERNELIMPSGFLSAAHRFGLSVELDKWVIRHAVTALSRRRVESPRLCYAINLSSSTLTTPGICELIQENLRETGLDPSALIFEVTETVAIADMAAAENFLACLQSMGCHTSLDDFGSGMASFAYLKDLPVNSVKIDGRFVKNLAASPVDQAMVKAMNEIAHALGIQTVAEFVENEESFKILAAYGVNFVQGYYLGRPEVALPCAELPIGRCVG